jgi:hypothetical protein
VVRRRRAQAGYSLLEVAVAMGVFVAIIAILAILTAELNAHSKRMPINFMKNPQISNVLSRLRRDVMDAYGVPPHADPYLSEHAGYQNGPKTLIIRVMTDQGLRTVVWDFREPGVARRRAYQVGVATEWVARGLPPEFNIAIGAVKIEDRPWGVLVRGTDQEGRIAIEQILQPRTHH